VFFIEHWSNLNTKDINNQTYKLYKFVLIYH